MGKPQKKTNQDSIDQTIQTVDYIPGLIGKTAEIYVQTTAGVVNSSVLIEEFDPSNNMLRISTDNNHFLRLVGKNIPLIGPAFGVCSLYDESGNPVFINPLIDENCYKRMMDPTSSIVDNKRLTYLIEQSFGKEAVPSYLKSFF